MTGVRKAWTSARSAGPDRPVASTMPAATFDDDDPPPTAAFGSSWTSMPRSVSSERTTFATRPSAVAVPSSAGPESSGWPGS